MQKSREISAIAAETGSGGGGSGRAIRPAFREIKGGLSREAVELHFEGHHSKYPGKLRALCDRYAVRYDSKEISTGGRDFQISRAVLKHQIDGGLRADEAHVAHLVRKFANISGQIENHNMYWETLSPARQEPSPWMHGHLTRNYGSFDGFMKCALGTCEGTTQAFGSGWYWIACKNGARGPIMRCIATGQGEHLKRVHPTFSAVGCIDLWQHAYYTDYRQNRRAYLHNIFSRLNWSQIERKLRVHMAGWARPQNSSIPKA